MAPNAYLSVVRYPQNSEDSDGEQGVLHEEQTHRGALYIVIEAVRSIAHQWKRDGRNDSLKLEVQDTWKKEKRKKCK